MIGDHGMFTTMETMSISKFKATCLQVLDDVRRTGRPVLVTKRGVPIAEVVPPSRPGKPRRVLGGAPGRIVGDIVSPVAGPDDWSGERTLELLR